MSDPAALLADAAVFSGLEPPARARILSLASTRRYAKGDVLFAEFQEGDELFLILDGGVSIQVALRNADDPYDVAVLGPGEILGEVNLVEEGIRSATAIAETDVELLVWDCALLREECERDPRLGYPLISAVAKVLAQRLRRWNVRLLDSALWGTV
jgi:CRP/FNR family transcriptional regulator